MAKTLGFTYKGVDYTLEFTRKTVSRMEQDGFSIGDIGEKPMAFFLSCSQEPSRLITRLSVRSL